MKNPGKYPIDPPTSLDRRLERMFDLFKIIFADHDIDDDERQLIKKYAIGLGYSNDSADIVISRAGASSVTELCIVGKPVIFIPSPNVAEDHQTKNAMAVVNKDAAIIIKEEDLEADFENKFLQLIAAPKRQIELGKNIKALALVNATKDIVNEVEKLLNK